MPIVLILAAGLAPAALYLAIALYARRQVQQSVHIATDRFATDRLISERFNRFRTKYSSDAHFVEGMGFVVGDITCKLNALSPYIRCAANPYGPCEDCQDYESKEYEPLA